MKKLLLFLIPCLNFSQSNCDCTNTSVICDYGSNQEEVSWFIQDASGENVASGGAPYSGEVCLENDCYILVLMDSGGDGWNNNVLVIGDQFFTGPSLNYTYDNFCASAEELSRAFNSSGNSISKPSNKFFKRILLFVSVFPGFKLINK
mgnify:CR=1 FL=1